MNVPNFMHKKSCTCPNSVLTQPCYVWFHYPNGPGKIHQFVNIQDAYKFAHDSTIDYISIPTLLDVDGKLGSSYKPEHLYDNDTIHCDVDWHIYLCDIVSDLKHQTVNMQTQIWNIAAGSDLQTSIGLGSTIPPDVKATFCNVEPIINNNNA